MKALIKSLGLATTLTSSFLAFAPTAQASRVSLDGYGNYRLSNWERYSSRGATQAGRYINLGADYYRRSRIGIDAITNRSRYRSGSLSYELWAMPFFGANSGTVLMTSNPWRVNGFTSRNQIYRYGYAVSLGESAFPELNLWEYTRYGWKFRDAISFSYKDLL